jgi:hypothetical protein
MPRLYADAGRTVCNPGEDGPVRFERDAAVMQNRSMRTPEISPRATSGWMKSAIAHPRLLQAVKTAVGVAIAWKLAPYMPGVADEYPYYAPLGVIVASYPTLMGSLKNAWQTLAGLAIGIILAAAVVIFSEPSVLTVALVVGVGMLFGGIRQLGAGREYVPIAGLFVLIVGGPEADGYSIGYLSQMSLGIVVGLLVNLLVAPPTRVTAAVKELSRLRGALGTHLGSVADALEASWPPEESEWSKQGDTLAGTTSSVRRALAEADEAGGSTRGRASARMTSPRITTTSGRWRTRRSMCATSPTCLPGRRGERRYRSSCRSRCDHRWPLPPGRPAPLCTNGTPATRASPPWKQPRRLSPR